MTPCISCGGPVPVGSGGRHKACMNPARTIRSGRPWRLLSEATRAVGVCARCGTTSGPFEANHVEPLARDPWQSPRAECLCRPCHRRVTAAQGW